MYLSFTDYTTQEYFERKRAAQFPNAQARMAATCLTYLSFDVFGDHDFRELESLLEDNALLDYAAKHWGHHTRGQAEERLKRLGASISSSVTKKTTAVVVGDQPGSKLARAQQLGTQVVDEAEFLAMLDRAGQ